MVQPILLSQKIPNLHLDITSSHSDSFSVIHWQCEADLRIEDRTLVVDDKQFDNKALNFVVLAKKQNTSLALTPEYSFSWKLLDKIIADPNLQPTASKLWCFGMQYIQLSDFDQWCCKHASISIEDFAIHASDGSQPYVVIFDGFRERKKFVNVLVYLFVTEDHRLIVLMQSKLEHMRDPLYDFEASDLSLGNRIFLFNEDNSGMTLFCSLICADAFQKEYYDKISACTPNKPILLFHPQCNTKPYHDTLMMRVNYNLDSNWSFLRLNWSQNSSLCSQALNTLGTDYIYKERDNIKDTWGKGSFRECYVKNRSKGLNLLMDNSWKCQWTFPWQEHVAQYSIKKTFSSSTVIHTSNQFVANEIYIYQNDWDSCQLCPLKIFEDLTSKDCSDFIADLKVELACSNCVPGDRCSLLLWDRFVSLCRGNADHEIFFKSPKEDELINYSITNLSKEHMHRLVKLEFDGINKMGNYLKNIVKHSQDSENVNIKTLQYLVPDGVHLCVDKNFPQNKRTMFNLKGNPPSNYGAMQEGHIIYTKDTLTEDLNLQLANYSKKTEAKELGVLLFYPDGDNAVQLFPNPQWKHSTDIGPHGARHTNPSDTGIGGSTNG